MKTVLGLAFISLFACAPAEGPTTPTSGVATTTATPGSFDRATFARHARDCRSSELAVDESARPVNANRFPKSLPAAQYARMQWAPGHRAALTEANFVIPKAEAIERIIAIEAKHPGLIPAAFREGLSAEPRDPVLRVLAASCEKQWSKTGRRAIYDALLAYLLMPNPADVAELKQMIDQGRVTTRRSGLQQAQRRRNRHRRPAVACRARALLEAVEHHGRSRW